ncbi:hypothetical protein EJB05_55598, partial [Eragrostis curvula]
MANIDDDEGVQKPADGLDDAWERRMQRARDVQGCILGASIIVLMLVCVFGTGATEVASFSVKLTGFKGLNATLGNTVSPSFKLKVRVENPRRLQAWCSNGGEVVISYVGVALAWGQVPGFCVPRKEVRKFILLPWGRGVGLSEDLHRRLASELLTGTTHVLAEMKLFKDAYHWTPSEAYSGRFQLMLA